jgi:thioesterase domain-containing protein
MIHGGQHTRHCWSPTIDALHTLSAASGQPLNTLAVNLPGRDTEPGDLATLTIAQCVASVCRQIEARHAGPIILVGHSMAGITLPGVATHLGPDRVKQVVFLACCVPPQGQAVSDTLKPPISWVTRLLMAHKTIAKPMPNAVARWLFTNGATAAQHRHMEASLCNEAVAITREAVDRRAFQGFNTQWIITRRDRALAPALQRQFIANLGGVDRIDTLDTCHNAMITEPQTLAQLLWQSAYPDAHSGSHTNAHLNHASASHT